MGATDRNGDIKGVMVTRKDEDVREGESANGGEERPAGESSEGGRRVRGKGGARGRPPKLVPGQSGTKELLACYLRHNPWWKPGTWRSCHPGLLRLALEYKYVHWPLSLAEYVRGRDVYDLGCGRSLHGVGFLLAGARTYTGVDPRIELDVDAIKDPRQTRSGYHHRIGWTPRRISRAMPRLRYRACLLEELGEDEACDVLVLHNVTEHLMNIREILAGFAAHVRVGGRLIFRHPNFYAWNGHHMAPRYVEEAEAGDPLQAPFLDWGHLVYDESWPDEVKLYQNRIRLGELKDLVARAFDLERWEPKRSNLREGLGRLSDEVLARHPDFTREELETQSVLCVARRRASAGTAD